MAIMCHEITDSNTHFENVTRRLGNGAAQLALLEVCSSAAKVRLWLWEEN